MPYELIEAERKNFAIRLMCQVLEISESGYYASRNRKPSPRTQANEAVIGGDSWCIGHQVVGLIVHHRIAAQLCKSGVEVSVNRVARLMQKARLSACVARIFVRTTVARVARTV